MPRVMKLVGESPSRALARHRRTGVPRGETVSPLRAETHCLVPRGARVTSLYKDQATRKIQDLFAAPSLGPPQPGWPTVAAPCSLVGALLLGSDLSPEEGSCWNVMGGCRGS